MLLQLVDLHQNTGVHVCVGHKLSKRFHTSSGVRQGCILAPAISCIATDWILKHMSMKHGIYVGAFNFTDLVYADGITLFLPSTDDASIRLSSFTEAEAPLGLKISWAKTKLQNLGSGPALNSISIDSSNIKSVENFIYLGSLQSLVQS